jgi:hypothetical protein
VNDRELLEAAAKAAGIRRTIEWLGHHEYLPNWNPLEDDADAFRLAVKLVIDIFPPRTEDDCAKASAMDGPGAYEDQKRDPYAATRRAIVRSAAELSKQGA